MDTNYLSALWSTSESCLFGAFWCRSLSWCWVLKMGLFVTSCHQCPWKWPKTSSSTVWVSEYICVRTAPSGFSLGSVLGSTPRSWCPVKGSVTWQAPERTESWDWLQGSICVHSVTKTCWSFTLRNWNASSSKEESAKILVSGRIKIFE